jgi:hypothetical protein
MLSMFLGVVGIAAIVAGVWLVFPPAALVVFGAVAVRVAVSLDRPKEPT